ncbi:MAG TPA: VWA domain-containing protein [Archangium sp.]|nr:VWA domain-containing protein [Archangium sp.]
MKKPWKKLLTCALSLPLLSACGEGLEPAPETESLQAIALGDVRGEVGQKAQLVVAERTFGAPSMVTLAGNRYGMILIDRTGSMMQQRSTGNSRCKDALIQARGALTEFFGTAVGGTHMAVWTFTNSAVTKLTPTYVGKDDALAALNSLDPSGCSGSTPLADAMCWVADDMQALEPKPTLLHVATDGYENNSYGECSGPSGSYTTPGTWQNKVLTRLTAAKVRARVDFWVAQTTLELAPGNQANTLTTCSSVEQCEEQFFAALAEQTGGEYHRVKDNNTAYPCTDPALCPAPTSSTFGNLFTFSASNTTSATTGTTNHNVYLAAGETLRLGTCNVGGASGSGDTYLRLHGLAGTEVAANDDSCGLLSNLSYTVPAGASGTYQIRAGCFSSGSCSGTVAYTIHGSFSYSASNTLSATTNTVNRGVYLRPGQHIQLGTCNVAGASGSGDTYLRLSNATSTEVAVNDDSCGLLSNLSYSVSASTSGNYQIRAGCFSNNSCGGTVAYTISDAAYTCQPRGCAEAGASCGSISDGCGGTLFCGGCPTNHGCVNNTCQPMTTCAVEPCPLPQAIPTGSGQGATTAKTETSSPSVGSP